MFGFIIKKSFCDGWDNLLSVIVANLCLTVLCVGTFMISSVFKTGEFLISEAIMYFILVSIISIVAFGYSEVSVKIADFNSIKITDFFKALPKIVIPAILFAILCGILFIVSVFAINFYFLHPTGKISMFIGAVIVWVDLFLILSLQWFIPLHAMFHNKFLKCLKKCFIISLDNFGFSLAVFAYNLVLLAFTVLFVGFFPSCAGILIADSNALRILIYKYDYLEEHPELQSPKDRKKIPWEELIYEDRQTLGPRKLKSFLFPWKDEAK